jgi:ATP-dependent RNA helicase RhlE
VSSGRDSAAIARQASFPHVDDALAGDWFLDWYCCRPSYLIHQPGLRAARPPGAGKRQQHDFDTIDVPALSTETVTFADLGLLEPIQRAVAEAGYVTPTPIQAKAIPAILAGRDIMGSAQTGTGKTAGFTLPMLHRLSVHANKSVSPARHPVRALILTPTRELAAQVEESIRTYGKHSGLKTALVYGGVDIVPQIKQLRSGVEIVVATPGRLLDHVSQKTVGFQQVEFLVLDEADRMLDMGFIPDIKRIIAMLPAKRQNLLFSATFSEDIKRLADGLLNQPVLIEVARRNSAAETVTHTAYPVEERDKRPLLAHLIRSFDIRQALVFVRTKHGANRLAHQLVHDGVDATAIHSDKTQQAREQALADFKAGSVRILVATDIAARGLDIELLPHVINFELPYSPEDYVHRIGRTGRAGANGDAISLFAPDEEKLLLEVERLLKRSIPRVHAPDFGRTARSSGSRDEPRHEPRRSGQGDHRRPQRPDRSEARLRTEPTVRVATQPPTAHAPAAAHGGFDFSKPYESSGASSGEAAPGPSPKRDGRTPRPRQVAALLGGLRPAEK